MKKISCTFYSSKKIKYKKRKEVCAKKERREKRNTQKRNQKKIYCVHENSSFEIIKKEAVKKEINFFKKAFFKHCNA